MTLAPIDGLTKMAAAEVAAFRERLTACGYDASIIAAAEGVAPGLLDALRLPLVRRWLSRREDDASTLAALFAYRAPVSSVRVRSALGDALTASLSAAGLIEARGDVHVSRFVVMPCDGSWLVSDYLDDGEDAVMGPGLTTMLLHRAIADGELGDVLDLGCGAGSLAISAARRGARAVGTDISSRAIVVASFNARLNAVSVDFRQGDCTAPVAPQAFDLVLSQPPYVPLPAGRSGSTFLHGGSYGDELALRFVAECARVLAPGGRALLHFDSAVRPDAPLADRLKDAIGDAPTDAVALVDKAPPPDHQAVAYAASTHETIGERYAEVVVAYRDHLESLAVKEMSRLLLVLRRPREGAVPGGRYRIVMPAAKLSRMQANAIPDLLASIEVAMASDAVLATTRLALPEGTRFVEERDSPEAQIPTRLALRMAEGSLAEDRDVSDRGWVIFTMLASGRTVGEAITRFAEMSGEPIHVARREVIGLVREALARGLLTPISRA